MVHCTSGRIYDEGRWIKVKVTNTKDASARYKMVATILSKQYYIMLAPNPTCFTHDAKCAFTGYVNVDFKDNKFMM